MSNTVVKNVQGLCYVPERILWKHIIRGINVLTYIPPSLNLVNQFFIVAYEKQWSFIAFLEYWP